MSLDLHDAALAPLVERLHPYMPRLLERAAERALRIHADEVTIEHLLGACMEDEECAAHQVVVHAFADPETLDFEFLALSPGTMVVASQAALPFSPRALTAIRSARLQAIEARASVVADGLLLWHCARALPAEVAADLAAAGYASEGLDAPEPGAGVEIPGESPLFRHFSTSGKKALSLANKASHAGGEASIGPARLFVALLQAAPDLAAHAGIAVSRARMVLQGRTCDATPPEPRALRVGADLLALLPGLPGEADSLDLLAAGRSLATDEVRELLQRHKVTDALLARARDAFRDPELPPPPPDSPAAIR